MADENPNQAATIPIPTTEPELPLIPLDESALNPEYDPAKDQRAPFLKTPINPTGPTISPAPPRSVGQVIKEAATENIPQFSSRTVSNPNYGKQSFLPDSEIMTQQQRREAPALAGSLDVASELASPATIGTVAATAGVGEAGVIPKVLSGLFAGQIATSVYDQYPALKDAVNRAQTAKTKDAHDDAFADAQRILTHMGANTVMGLLAAKHGAEGAKEILDATTGSGVPDQASTFKNPGVEPVPQPEETHPEMNRETVKQLQKLGYSNQHITNFNISEIRDILKNQTPAADHPVSRAPKAKTPAPEPNKFAEAGGKFVGQQSSVRPIEQATVETTPEGGKITTGSPENTKDIFAAERQLVSSGRLTQADIGRLRNNAMDRWEAAGRPGGVFENFYANALRQATSINVSADPIEDLIMSDKIGGKKVRGAIPQLPAAPEPEPEAFAEHGGKFVGEAPKAPAPSTGYSVPTEKLQKMPASTGRPEVHTIRHELGHALVGQKEGLTPNGVISDSHPLASSDMRAAVEWSPVGIIDPNTQRIYPDMRVPYVRALMGGIAADEAFNDLPRSANNNFFLTKGGDGTRAYKILRAAGFDHEGALDEMHKAIDDGKEYLTHPTVSGIIKENENTREMRLSPQYHYSPDRLQNMHTEIQQRIANEKQNTEINDNGTVSGPAAEGRSGDVTSGKGEVSAADKGLAPEGEEGIVSEEKIKPLDTKPKA